MLKEILKKHGIEDNSIQEILKSMEESKVYITKEQNIDERYSKLKNQKIELDKIVADRDKQLEELRKNNINNSFSTFAQIASSSMISSLPLYASNKRIF